MDQSEFTEYIESRRVRDDEDEITQRHRYDFPVGQEYVGELVIEYKAEEREIPPDGFTPLSNSGTLDELMWGEGGEEHVREFVSTLYRALVDTLFPSHAYVDEPWEHVALVVELRYENEGTGAECYASLGTYA